MKVLVRVVIALLLVAGFGWLFLRTASDVRSEPYVVSQAHLQPWVLSLETATDSRSPMLVLQPAQELGGGLFSQIFQRMMESMKGTTGGGMPLVLRDEYELALAGRYTPQGLLDAARAAGLETSTLTPVCVATRRISEPGLTRQMYFVVFDAPAVVAFREQLAREATQGIAPLDPTVLSPILIVAATEADFDRWLPLQASESDCLAPIVVD